MWDYISETPEAIAAYAATHVAILAHVAIYLMYGLEIFLIWILTSCINRFMSPSPVGITVHVLLEILRVASLQGMELKCHCIATHLIQQTQKFN